MKIWTMIAALALLPGCDSGGSDEGGSSGSGTMSAGETAEPTGGGEDETQVPPTSGHADMQVWLKAGHYKSWTCQTGVQEPIMISPHGKQRICSNAVLSAHGDGEYPVDSAAVKELYDEAGANIVGYAVYRHISAGKTGDNWYWYEVVPDSSMAPHDANGVVADQVGTMGSAPGKDLCVSCHSATGIDADHPGHDFVYEQVK